MQGNPFITLFVRININIRTIGSKTQRVPKVMNTKRLVSDDAGNVNINHEDSKPDEVTHGCTEKERQYYSFVV